MKPNPKLSLLLVAVFIMGLAGTAMANHHKGGWEKKDADGDGVVTMQEYIDYKMKWFDKKDTNGDGNISKDEMTVRIKEKFSKMDANGDGKITKEEKAAYKKNKMAK